MSVSYNRPFFGNHLYIAGMPSGSFEEKMADACLLFPSHLSKTMHVTIMTDEKDLKIDYIRQGCILQLFEDTVLSIVKKDTEYSSPLFTAAMIPVYLTIGLTYAITCIAAKPFELIGKCMKNIALELNPKAMAYNQLAEKQIQFLQANGATLDHIASLKKALESYLLMENIHALVCENTKSQPEDFISLKLAVDDSSTIELILKPIVENGDITDYEILAPNHRISCLPTTKNKLGVDIKTKSTLIPSIENEFLAKLNLFNTGSQNFEMAIETLLNPQTEKTPLIN